MNYEIIKMENISEQNELIYTEDKLFSSKIRISPRNPNGNTKPWREERLEVQMKNYNRQNC